MTDLILAMTAYLPVSHTAQVHCCGVIQWWACSSVMCAPLLADAGWESCQQTVLLFPRGIWK